MTFDDDSMALDVLREHRVPVTRGGIIMVPTRKMESEAVLAAVAYLIGEWDYDWQPHGYASASWTGRRHSADPWTLLQGAVLVWLYPHYPCLFCVGQDFWQGCYCTYHGALSPGGPGPGPIFRALRLLAEPILKTGRI